MSKHAGPLGKLTEGTECIVNRPYISQMGLREFWLATNHQFFEKCAKNVHIEKLIRTFFLKVDCVSYHINVCYQVPRRRNFNFISTCSEVTVQTSWRVSSLFWFIVSHHMMRRKKSNDFWLFCAESFPVVYNINDFVAIIFRRYYTLTDVNRWLTRSPPL